jgi:Lipocalin-like domain
MNRRGVLIAAAALLCLGVALPSGNTMAQQKSLKEQILGTWTLVSVIEVYQDGRKDTPWGPAVKGAVNFDGNGKFTFMIIGADLPSPSGKPQESSRMTVAYFGTYAVDEAAKTVTYTAERATTPSFDGLARRASVSVSGDELVQTSAPITTPQGTFTPNLVLKRAK